MFQISKMTYFLKTVCENVLGKREINLENIHFFINRNMELLFKYLF